MSDPFGLQQLHPAQQFGAVRKLRVFSPRSEYLELRERDWDGFGLEDLTGFLGWMRSGLPPEVSALTSTEPRISDATAAVRLQGVRSFYLFHQWRGLDVIPPLFTGRMVRAPNNPLLGYMRHRLATPSAPVRVRRRRQSAPRPSRHFRYLFCESGVFIETWDRIRILCQDSLAPISGDP